MPGYSLIQDAIGLVRSFDLGHEKDGYDYSLDGFRNWIADNQPCSCQGQTRQRNDAVNWEGKDRGRSIDSVINTQLLHLNRYARMYAKAAIHGSIFATPEEFIYLINLRAYGKMTKMELIRMNVQDKSLGVQIINRLIRNELLEQVTSELDRRSKVLSITPLGEAELDNCMDRIRMASKMVTGNLNSSEKHELVRLLAKLEDFHAPIYSENGSLHTLLQLLENQEREDLKI